jgi:hypothetical protein
MRDSPILFAFSISRVRPHDVPNRLPLYCDGSIAIVQGDVALFVEGPEFLLVELACALAGWLAGGRDGGFSYTTSDEDEGPTLALAPTRSVWKLSSSFVHEPGSFGGDDARLAARNYIQALERRLMALGHSMSRCPPPGVPVGEWNAMLAGRRD